MQQQVLNSTHELAHSRGSQNFCLPDQCSQRAPGGGLVVLTPGQVSTNEEEEKKEREKP